MKIIADDMTIIGPMSEFVGLLEWLELIPTFLSSEMPYWLQDVYEQLYYEFEE